MVTVDHTYHQKIIGKANSGNKIHAEDTAKTITNVILHDWTKRVKANQKRKNSQGLIQLNKDRSISVKKFSQSFINEKAKKIRPKLSKNFPNASTLLQWVKKLTNIAQKNIKINAIIDTSKLNHTIHKIEVGIIVHIFVHNITARAEVKDKIHVHTKANTNTDITFELCKIVVIKIQLINDFDVEEVKFFIKFLNHHVENHETACSI